MIAIRRNGIAVLRNAIARRRAVRGTCEGSVPVEYGLIAALLAIAILVTLTQIRDNLLALPFPALIAAFTEALS